MTKKSIKKILNIIGVIVFLSLIIFSIVIRIIDQKDLKTHGVLVESKIIRVNAGGKTGGGFQCIIKYKNKNKVLSSPSSLIYGKDFFVNKTFPAMYSPNTDVLEILITPTDFEKFNIPFPDSLNWLLPYIRGKYN
ncbi:MAG TPA: hypothetical protein VFT78_07945 [Hanamia sp.]|nr:hypothetical protein [Hanamia sp.]